MTYQLTIVEHPTYLHAIATGSHSAQNVLRFLTEAYEACVKRGHASLLLEVNFTGPSLDVTSIFRVISQRVADAAKLASIAYVDTSSGRDAGRKVFAENVALNRGANVRLFTGLEAAREWLGDRADDTPA
jgi:hypothetical protein